MNRTSLGSALALLFSTGLLLCFGPRLGAQQDAQRNAQQNAQGQEKMMSIRKSDFGKTPDGQAVEMYTLTNKNGLVAKVMTYGATLVELHTPDRNGKPGDIVLGFDNLDQYVKESPYFGCTTGRVANRIGNARFTINGKEYKLEANNGPNTLHGGKKGLDKRVWKAEPTETKDGPAVVFSYLSPDMEEGFPGNLNCTVTYTLTNNDELTIDYKATTDKPTPVNLTNHSYFNFSPPGTILDHVLMINADRYTPVDDTLIPTGEIAPVKGTPMDFTAPTPIGQRIEQVGKDPTGYDHNYVLNGEAGKMKLCARVEDPESGRVMEIYTTEPGVQFYSGNFLDGKLRGKYGYTYPKHAAFCLETQHFPDSVNRPQFPSTILNPGETYTTTTVHRFSTKK